MTTALDLFAGAGGWSLACERLGIDEVGVEIMSAALDTRAAAGFKSHETGDVWGFDFAEHRGRFDGLIASPPCQTFSAAGKGAGRKALDQVHDLITTGVWKHKADLREAAVKLGDERTALVLTPLHAAWEIRPEWIAWEQVPTVLPVWEACAEALCGMGYSVWTGNLQSEMFGVPQTRKRAFLIAHREREIAPPTPTHSRYYSRNPTKLDPGVQKWVSMAEALGWGLPSRPSPTITGGGTETGGAEPIAKLARYTSQPDWQDRNVVYVNGTHANAARRPVDRPAPTVMFGARGNDVRWAMGDVRSKNGCIRDMDQPAPTMTSSMDNGNFQFIERPEWPYNRPSTTVVGSFKPEIIAAPGYRTTVSRQNAEGSVRVTVEEAGVLQSFPADFPWQGAKTKQYLQCGNAVPPLLAEAVLRTLV